MAYLVVCGGSSYLLAYNASYKGSLCDGSNHSRRPIDKTTYIQGSHILVPRANIRGILETMV